MRHFGPPHSPDLIPSMEPDVPADRQRPARQGQGQDQDRRRRRVRLSAAGGGDLQDPGRAAEGRTPCSTAGSRTGWRASDLGPEAATEEGKARAEKGKAQHRQRSRSTWPG